MGVLFDAVRDGVGICVRLVRYVCEICAVKRRSWISDSLLLDM